MSKSIEQKNLVFGLIDEYFDSCGECAENDIRACIFLVVGWVNASFTTTFFQFFNFQ